jgi:hypothetical protein
LTPDRYGCEIPASGGTNERQNGFIVAGEPSQPGKKSNG